MINNAIKDLPEIMIDIQDEYYPRYAPFLKILPFQIIVILLNNFINFLFRDDISINKSCKFIKEVRKIYVIHP